ncbi:MAG TPA: hypothetical protein DDW52_06315 [Planctomycetaceae bacterium]|nr:hypothetical protein [Planctomycetaceae bacterium]
MPDLLFVGGNGTVYALRASDCSVHWTTALKSGWLVSGSPFVSLRETDKHLYAFSYGTLYKLDKRTGAVLQAGDQIKNLKHRAGVFSTTFDSNSASFDDACLAGDDGSGDGDGGGGDGDGGGDGGD